LLAAPPTATTAQNVGESGDEDVDSASNLSAIEPR